MSCGTQGWFLFPNSVWERRLAKLCFAAVASARETEFRKSGSQTEFGNQGKQGNQGNQGTRVKRIRVMAERKTKPTDVSVDTFLNGVADAQQREDSFRVLEIMKEITGKPPKMWGPTMVGFGDYHYIYASGHEGDTLLTGFSPRKGALTLYFMAGLDERFAAQLKKLGKVKTSKGCLYIKKLADVDLAVLREMIQANIAHLAGLSKPPSKGAPAKKGRKKE
jgi:hypothetical protein